jgi:hypothetical protein
MLNTFFDMLPERHVCNIRQTIKIAGSKSNPPLTKHINRTHAYDYCTRTTGQLTVAAAGLSIVAATAVVKLVTLLKLALS